ncbi:MAG TPA: hypothetical protein VGD42_05365 [Lysobacter sp.]
MKKLVVAFVASCVLLAAAGHAADPTPTHAQLTVRPFAVLPADFRHPESMASDPASGTLYVGSFDAREPAASRTNQLLRLSPDGKVLGRKSLGATPLTGLAFFEGKLYFLNFGASKLQSIDGAFDDASPIRDIAAFTALTPPAPAERKIANPDGSADTIHYGASGFPALNGLVFARNGDAYVSDSFQGAIYRIANAARCTDCKVEVVSRDPLLTTTGALPFGANGLAFDADERHLYINNAGDNRVLRMDVATRAVDVLAESIHGADGLLFHDGLLWVSANQADAVVALDANGRERARASGFAGINPDGTPNGLLFPAATAVVGDRMIVANLAMPITAAKGDEWEEDVRRWNLVQFGLPAATGR